MLSSGMVCYGCLGMVVLVVLWLGEVLHGSAWYSVGCVYGRRVMVMCGALCLVGVRRGRQGKLVWVKATLGLVL